jgi:3,4-dihydroxyphenylacetate 2,3-dioxygenase
MGEVVAAALVGHVPTVMLDEEIRRAISGSGRDTTLVEGFARLREQLDAKRVDTLVILDTHWFTTLEHVIAGAEHHAGLYTPEELPRVIHEHAFDYPGAPELAERIAEVGRERRVRVTNATSPSLPYHYPTLNLVHYLHRGEQVLSIGICQTAEADDFLELGSLLREAVERGDQRVAILASGGMSHRFWPMKQLPEHQGFGPEHVISDAARAADRRILECWAKGDHAAVLDFYPEYRGHAPEGFFGHYLILLGALGGASCTAIGTPLSEYEAAVGTGQIHVLFDI